MQLIVNNDNIKYEFDTENPIVQDQVQQAIYTNLNPLEDNRYHNMAYIRGQWDGRVKICDIENHLVPTGLYTQLLSVLDNINGIHYQVHDERDLSLVRAVTIPTNFTITDNVNHKTYIPRDYQLASVKAVLAKQRGIALESMNAGKTLIMEMITKLFLPVLSNNHKIFITTSASSVVEQLVTGFSNIFGSDKVSRWQGSQHDFSKPILIASARTVANNLAKPKVKLTTSHDKQLERFATIYAKQVLDTGSYRNNLALLIRNFPNKYKYQVEDKELLKAIYRDNQTDRKIDKIFTKFANRYQRLIEKKAGKDLTRYQDTLNALTKVDIAMCDEVQNASANTYQTIFKHVPNAVVRVGFTGTMPKQKDKDYLIRALFGNNIINVTDKQLIARGISAHPHIRLIKNNQPVDLEKQAELLTARQTSGNHLSKQQHDLINYQNTYNLGVVDNDVRNHLVAKLAVRLAEFEHQQGTRFTTLILVNSIQHGENISNELAKLNANYVFVQGATDNDIRQDVLNKANNHQLDIIVATKIFDAGVDIKTFKYLIYASAGKSFIQTIQRAGRLLRTAPNKQNVYIYDIVDSNASYLYNQAKQRIKYYREREFDFN